MEQKIFNGIYKTKKKIFKETSIKVKIINNLTKNGKKNLSENLLFKCVKELQKESNKNSKKLIQLSLVYSILTFKLYTFIQKKHKKKKKKEIPAFITSKITRIFLAIKFLLYNINKKKLQKQYKQLKKEILLNSQIKNNVLIKKNELKENISFRKHTFRSFKW